MGKVTRWIKGIFGMKKDVNNGVLDSDRKERKRWSFAKSVKDVNADSSPLVEQNSVKDSDWFRSFLAQTESEQNKHAIAVAAATAAAADAAVAAAQAAVAVVRLTSHGRGALFGGGGRERFAAVKIQTVYRGYLVIQLIPLFTVLSLIII